MVMKLKKIGILIILLITIQSFSAQWDYEHIVTNNFDKVTDVFTCGRWEDEEKSGVYRVIYTEFLYGCSWLYIQWIQINSIGSQDKVIHTLSIYDNDHHENLFEKPNFKENESGITLNYQASNGHSGTKTDIELNVFHEIGKYKLIETCAKYKVSDLEKNSKQFYIQILSGANKNDLLEKQKLLQESYCIKTEIVFSKNGAIQNYQLITDNRPLKDIEKLKNRITFYAGFSDVLIKAVD